MKTNGQLNRMVGFTSQNRQEDPPEPDEVETSMRETKAGIEFADRMIRGCTWQEHLQFKGSYHRL
jgi:hypothetical protein